MNEHPVTLGSRAVLTVVRATDHGVVLDARELGEILLPARYVTADMTPGSEVDVFIYRDSDDRLVATTDAPMASVGEVAWLLCTDVNKAGAFLDWGLPKDLLVPFREQRTRMEPGRRYAVYVYIDHNSGRIAATAKIAKYIDNVIPRYRHGDKVEALVVANTPLGFKAVVDNRHSGIFYANELRRRLVPGERVEAYVRHVRTDGKIDLRLDPVDTMQRIGSLEQRIVDAARSAGGTLPLGDKSSPEAITAALQCSKKDFKRAVGTLYRRGLVIPGPLATKLLESKS